ncbi:serine/threonine-protein kinase [Branchiibius hedensis]|uniref:non-specific serine/threonine protein kinase n=1 Tax=Branchiibius hedensis TaxID=672460 RepID=A0A2Y8ZQI8_9MICO|nr:Stk1 family PASTA domain-containing Ser/Thr kinase [Branchiibius hedensis]PWJ24840.1 serine/threonine-protein kinase [Branchiibius hedensis]SSA33656.1 serine/threonine protein kinase [Branchiibius hedensis]
MTTAPPNAAFSLVGRVVDGRYRVIAHLADGGMGSVFVAVDERLDREVALKIMRADLARDEAFVARFRREARNAARLSHPGVVAVTDQGQDGPYVFIAMELVRGRTLRDVLRADAPLQVDRALGILEPVLAALAAAHDAGIVHRDVKPENVLIAADGTVKVADFGLARAVSTQTLTADSDMLLGTAAYLAPEQVEFGTASEQTDVYAAGLLLFEMLTGRKAFPGEVPIQVAYQHVHGQLPLPSELADGVPAALDDIVEWASAKDPTERPADAAELLRTVRDVRRALPADQLAATPVAHEPLPRSAAPRPDGATDRLQAASTKAIGRRPPASAVRTRRGRARRWWIAALLILALLGGAAAWTFTAGPMGTVAVPTVAGDTLGAAVTKIVDAGFTTSVRQEFSETVPAGAVVSTDPSGSTRRGSAVTLTVSKGKERFSVPTLAGLTQDKARAALSAQHLKIGTITQQYDDATPTGQVISSSPGAGASVKRDSIVDLVVSQGPQPVGVPNVTGQTQSAAEKSLADAGLKVAYGTAQNSDTVASGSVISQDPPDGQQAHHGDTVTLVLSKGPNVVTMPDVTGKDTATATSMLQNLGLKVTVDRYFGGIFDTVRSQSEDAGSKVKVGTTIRLAVV